MKQSNRIDANTLKQLTEAIEKRAATQQTSERRPQTPKQPPARQAAQREEQQTRPVEVIPNGQVQTRIWANKNVLGQIEWAIDQRRTTSSGIVCKSLRPEHLEDAIRGLYEASKWIKKTERRLYPRRLWFMR